MPEFVTIETTANGSTDFTPLPDGDYLFEIARVVPKYWPENNGKPESYQYNLHLRVIEPAEYAKRIVFHALDVSNPKFGWKIAPVLKLFGYDGKIVWDKSAVHWGSGEQWDIALNAEPAELIEKAMVEDRGEMKLNLSDDHGAPGLVGFRFGGGVKTTFSVSKGERKAYTNLDVYNLFPASEWKGQDVEDPELAENFSAQPRNLAHPVEEPAGLG